MEGFFFSHAYHNMSSFLEVEKMMEQRRAILAQYPQFNISSHHPFEKVPTESAAAAPSNFIQTVGESSKFLRDNDLLQSLRSS